MEVLQAPGVTPYVGPCLNSWDFVDSSTSIISYGLLCYKFTYIILFVNNQAQNCYYYIPNSSIRISEISQMRHFDIARRFLHLATTAFDDFHHDEDDQEQKTGTHQSEFGNDQPRNFGTWRFQQIFMELEALVDTDGGLSIPIMQRLK